MTKKQSVRPSTTKPVAPKPDEVDDTKRVTQPDRLEALLRNEGGVTMVEITGALGVLPHTARAMISGLRKKRGLTVELRDGRYSAG